MHSEDAPKQPGSDYKGSELHKPTEEELKTLSSYDRATKMTEYVLSASKKNSENRTLPGPKILEAAKSEFPTVELVDNTFVQYLSKSAADENSNIATPGRRKGYYISRFVEELAREEATEDSSEDAPTQILSKRKFEREKLLYPVLVNWVQEQGYRAMDTSSIRARGRWSNPDVTGVRSTETFGSTEVEVLSIEAKLNSQQWDYDVFEAVSHRRFTNRSYFAFAATPEAVPKLDHASMRYYAELYGIGMLIVAMSKDVHDSLTKPEEKHSKRREDPITLDEADVLEMYSAPFYYVQPRWQMEYCKNVGIERPKDLWTWGENFLADV